MSKKPSAKPARKKQTVDEADLTPQQELFVAEYLKDLNGTQSAIRAGYSSKTAAQQASRLLTNVKVQAAIAAGFKERSERTKIDADWVLKRLAEEINADIADLYDEEGNLLPVAQWPMAFRKGLVAGIEVEEIFDGTGKARVKIGEVKKIKLSDRAKRLELIGRHIDVQAFKEKQEHDISDPLRDFFREIGGRSIRPGGAGSS